MGSRPSVFSKTPEEHAKDTKSSRCKRQAESRRTGVWRRPAPPPPGYIRVQLYRKLQMIREGRESDIEADVPLDMKGGGELDLDMMCKLWGLERCLPIDPMRWTIFKPGRKNRLSPVAVQVLSEGQGCIKFIEPRPSATTVRKRAIRQFVLSIVAYFALVYASLIRYLDVNTPFIKWRRRAGRRRKILQWQWARWASENDVENRWRSAVGILLVIIMMISLGATMCGYVNLHLKERCWQWARTGSIAL